MSFAAFLSLFARLKWRQANNLILGLRRHLWVHFAIGMLVLIMLVGGGTTVFTIIFNFLMKQDVFGRPLMDRLVRMVLLAFFSMLIFSNLIIMLTTTYISREVEFLMSQPIRHRYLFFAKLVESIVYSSWAFVILSFPLFLSMGRSREIYEWQYYAWVVMLIVPFLIIPASIGSVLTLVITAWFPPRRMLRLAIVLALVGLVGAALLQRFYGLAHILRYGTGQPSELGQVMRFLGIGDIPILPSSWLGRGLLAAEAHNHHVAALWASALWSTAAMGLVVCDWLAGPLYYHGWCNARTSGSARRRRAGGLYVLFDRILFWLPRSVRAMVTKDLTIFWRDPGQWGQLMILCGLLFIYMANLRSASGVGEFRKLIPFWQSIISMFNIGATSFVLSILTTRFVYPMLSLEGRQQWVIGLAPVPRTRLVWVKFIFSWLASLAVTLPLALLSAWMLKAEYFIYGLSMLTVLAVSLGLSALAVGLGASMPNFNEDNPSRIANGVGGTLTAILSLIYIGTTLALETPWVHAFLVPQSIDSGTMRLVLIASIPAWAVLQLFMIIVPMAIGLKRWKRMEF
ncbi:hypothetical protein LLG95_04495 [bacterium]|nr:hypothetical protein [bacterium]